MSKISHDSADTTDLYESLSIAILDGSMSKISDDSADTIELYESPESSQEAQDITKVLFSKFIDLFIRF